MLANIELDEQLQPRDEDNLIAELPNFLQKQHF
jgi:ATP-dependent Lon protease